MSVKKPRSKLVVLAALALPGIGAAVLVGGLGYGLTEEYGPLTDGGLWQALAVAALVVGGVLGVLALLLLRLTGRRTKPGAVMASALAFCLLAGAAGGQLGSAAHRQDQEARRASCAGGVAAEMRELRDLTRPAKSPYRSRPQRTPDGCVVDVSVSSRPSGDRAYVGRRIAPAGFRPDGEGAWVRGDLRVTLRSEESEGGREHLVVLTGTRG